MEESSDNGKIFNELPVIRTESLKNAIFLNREGDWPVSDGIDLSIFCGDTLFGYDVTQESYTSLKKEEFGGFEFEVGLNQSLEQLVQPN